jgi:hypothetical protein
MSTAALGTRQLPKPTDVHLLPCSVSYDGPAHVGAYFLLEDRRPGTSGTATTVAVASAGVVAAPETDTSGASDSPGATTASPAGVSEAASAGLLRAFFRGRGLEGEAVLLPDGCEGLVLEPGSVPLELAQAGVGRFYEVRHTFEAATVWQHDRDPGDDDPMHRALHWVNLAAAIHDD